ncbi:EAL domain-containing protein [Aminobacter aminovorans]|uniref:putative bifunctional diguanylate cyclase/phosphodiesterase n=1 Tax=Aminobacter aminovorans TaxID=83263 RepID=UPI002854C3D5|nr:EAL domain-containing protein [Aminobacter aminovorans]MDR7222972.1 diguanylate cyclase (GGDEF)-like protein [Aminobacter aminovorans]
MAALLAPGSRRAFAFRLLKALLIATIAAFAIAAAYLSVVIFERQAAIGKLSRYDVAWSASQGVNEYLRLYQRVATLAASPSEKLKADTQLRFQILKSRLGGFSTGQFEEFVAEAPERKATVAQLSAFVQEMDRIIPQIDQPGQAQSILASMRALEAELIGLASEANQYSAVQAAKVDDELLRLHSGFSAVAIGFFLCSLAFIALLRWHNRLLTQTSDALNAANEDLRRTSDDLETANAAVLGANHALATQNGLFDAALSNMSQGLCMFDADQRLIVSNSKFATMYGLPGGSLAPGTTPQQIMQASIDAATSTQQGAELAYHSQQQLIEKGQHGVLLQKLVDGRIVSILHQPMDSGGWVATYEDITERHLSEERIAHMARHDPLTGLPNRLMLRERLEQELAHGRRHHQDTAVLCLDLDNFKNVNDTLGHPVGDALLREVANRVSGMVREYDVVARLGGDEFIVIQPEVRREDVAHVAQRLIDALEEPYHLDAHHVVIGASIGIALASDCDGVADDMVKNADLALYRAKSDGRGSYQFYAPEMDDRLQRRRMLELDLRGADFDKEFELVFQPIVNLQSKQVAVVEALLRWPGCQRGQIRPDEFIPIAESTGLIVQLGAWVLEKACREAVKLPGNVSVAVNLSPGQFRRGNIVDTVANVLSLTGLAPERLELEITESLLLGDNKETLLALNRLHALGVKISLDDFGTGYSSLSYLRNFPVDKVKIDRSFIAEIAGNRDHCAIVSAIVNLSHALEMTTVAEGVETEEQLLIVRATGCDAVQGHFFSPPMSVAQLRRYLEDQRAKLTLA